MIQKDEKMDKDTDENEIHWPSVWVVFSFLFGLPIMIFSFLVIWGLLFGFPEGGPYEQIDPNKLYFPDQCLKP